MKTLITLILFSLSINTYAEIDPCEAERQKLINGLDNADYSVLLPFISRDDIQPFGWLLNGQAVVKEYKSWLNIPCEITPFTFKKAGKVVVYTNQYDLKFINDQEILWDLDDIKALPNAVCFGFYDMMKQAFKAKDPQDIIKLYNDYNDQLFEINRAGLVAFFLSCIKRTYDFSTDKDTLSDRGNIFDYLFPKLYPTKEQQRIFLLNLPLYSMSTRSNIHNSQECLSKNRIKTPYNKNTDSSYFLRQGQEYKCLFEEKK